MFKLNYKYHNVVKFKYLIDKIVETHLYMMAHSPGLVQLHFKKGKVSNLHNMYRFAWNDV
jgi:hypothetical protein